MSVLLKDKGIKETCVSKSQKLFLLSLLLVILAVCMLDTAAPLSAQTPIPTPTPVPLRWSVPRRIPGIADDADAPYLVADRNQTVHAFFSQWSDSEFAVFYSRWSTRGSWSRPIDILLSPRAHQAKVIGAFLDNKGMMHVIFFGGTAEGAEIYYSRAPVAYVGQASAWAPPEMVGPRATSPVAGMLTGDTQGNLYILYSGGLEGNGLYLVRSNDYGKTWSAPETVFLTERSSLWVAPIQGTLDEQGRLHVVWTVVNKAGNGEAVYYAHLESDHERWSRPFALQTVKGNDYEADWGAVVALPNELMVIYNYGFPPYRWARRSKDGGGTWSQPTIVMGNLKGENGLPIFAADSANNLHVVFANRTLDDKTVGLWHSEWKGDHWSESDAIVAGAGTLQFNPDWPQAIIAQGNQLLATWRQDPGITGNGVWYSYATLTSPELAVENVPTPAPTETVPAQSAAMLEPTLVPSRSPTPVVLGQSANAASPISPLDSPMTTIVAAAVSVLGFLSAIFVVRKLQFLIFR
jgi:hypothetical protein